MAHHASSVVDVVPCWIDNEETILDQRLCFDRQTLIGRSQYPGQSQPQPCLIQGVSRAQSQDATDSASRARDVFSATTPTRERLEILRHAARIMDEQHNTLVSILTQDLGVVSQTALNIVLQTMGELSRCIARLAEAAGPSNHINPPSSRPSSLPAPAYAGVTFLVLPSTLPLLLRTVVNALSSGRTTVLLASEEIPRATHFVVTMFAEAGLPAGCLNKIHVQERESSRIIEVVMYHAAVQIIEVCDGRSSVQDYIFEMGRKCRKHVVARIAATEA